MKREGFKKREKKWGKRNTNNKRIRNESNKGIRNEVFFGIYNRLTICKGSKLFVIQTPPAVVHQVIIRHLVKLIQLRKARKFSGLFLIVLICLYKIKKINKFTLTVENKYDSMKDALLWCYMPN